MLIPNGVEVEAVTVDNPMEGPFRRDSLNGYLPISLPQYESTSSIGTQANQ